MDYDYNSLHIEIRSDSSEPSSMFSDFYVEGSVKDLARNLAILASERKAALALLVCAMAHVKYNLNIIGDVELYDAVSTVDNYFQDYMSEEEFVAEFEEITK